jgi:hypothetical protein
MSGFAIFCGAIVAGYVLAVFTWPMLRSWLAETFR